MAGAGIVGVRMPPGPGLWHKGHVVEGLTQLCTVPGTVGVMAVPGLMAPKATSSAKPGGPNGGAGVLTGVPIGRSTGAGKSVREGGGGVGGGVRIILVVWQDEPIVECEGCP